MIAALSNNLLFVTCSGGIWYNPFTGDQDTIPGQVQLWNSHSMSLIDVYHFEWYSSPWHIVHSHINNEIFLTLAGDKTFTESNDIPSAGIVCLTYQSNILDKKWTYYSKNFEILHGIDVSKNGENIYASGRGDNNLHIFNNHSQAFVKSIPLINHSMAGGIRVISSP